MGGVSQAGGAELNRAGQVIRSRPGFSYLAGGERYPIVLKSDLRGMESDLRGMERDLRGMERDLRGVEDDLRGVQCDLRRMQGDLRGMPGHLRMTLGDLRVMPGDLIRISQSDCRKAGLPDRV